MGDKSFVGLFAEHLRMHYGLRFDKPTHILLVKKTSVFIRPLAGRTHLGLAPTAAYRNNMTDY